MKKSTQKKVRKGAVQVFLTTAVAVSALFLPQMTQQAYAGSTHNTSSVSSPTTGTYWTNSNLKSFKGSGNAPYYIKGTTFQEVDFAGQTWYIIGNETVNSTSTLVLLSDSQIGRSKFDDTTRQSSAYKNSYIYSALNSSDGEYTDLSYNAYNLFGKALEYVERVSVSATDSDHMKQTISDNYLYLPNVIASTTDAFTVGSNDQFKIPVSTWISNNEDNGVKNYFWLRSAYGSDSAYAVWPSADTYVKFGSVINADASVVPAFQLDLTKMLFASVAPAASSDTTLSLDAYDTMTLRIQDSEKFKSSVEYLGTWVKVTKDSSDTGDVYLCVQYKDGSSDKIYTKKIDESCSLDLCSIGDLSNAKIWVEMTSSDGKATYATPAVKSAHTHNWVYGTTTTNTANDTLTVSCSNADCIYGITQEDTLRTLTFSRSSDPTPIYYGDDYSFIIGTEDEIDEWTHAGLTIPNTVEFYEGSKKLSERPTYAGDFTAKLPAGSAAASVDYTIIKYDPEVTAPDAVTGLIYDGDNQTLITSGTTTGDGPLEYAVSEDDTISDSLVYSEDLPEGMDAGSYYVFYRVVETDKYYGKTFDTPVEVTIGKKDVSVLPWVYDEAAHTENSKHEAQSDPDLKDCYDTEGDVDGCPINGVTISREAGEKAGTYVLRASVDAKENPNYNVDVSKTGTFYISGHVWDAGTVKTPATCVSKGTMTYKCTVPGCSVTKEEDIAIDPQNHTGKTAIKNAVAETCGKEGYTGDTYCADCDVLLQKGSVIAATGAHTWDQGTVTKKQTDEEEGIMTYTCTVCGATKTESIPKLITYALNKGLKVSAKGNLITVEWGKVSYAYGYIIYANYCGNSGYTKLKTIKDHTVLTWSFAKLNKKKIDLTKTFKIYVAAVDKKGKVLGKSIVAHVVGSQNKKYTNVKNIKLTKTAYTIKTGKTAKIKATTVLADKKKIMLSEKHISQFRYASTDRKVATVTKDGVIKGVKAGTCIVYVYAGNGYAKQIKVTVK